MESDCSHLFQGRIRTDVKAQQPWGANERLLQPKPFTVAPEDQRCGRAEHLLPGDGVVNDAGVVADIRGLHFRDVQAAGLLRDESTTVLLHKVWVFVEDPGKCQV